MGSHLFKCVLLAWYSDSFSNIWCERSSQKWLTPALAEAITASRLGPPLLAFARAVIDAGRNLGPPAAGRAV
jgi:hypothetical protein